MTIATTPPSATRLEPTFADLIVAIEQAPELSAEHRRHWVCSVRQIAKWLDRPAVVIPARWPAVRIPVSQLHHTRVGVTAKTSANHKSNVRAALRWYGKEQGVPQQGARLSPEWERFLQQLESSIRQRLYNLVRYCSARCIGPTSLDDAIFDDTGATAPRTREGRRTIPPGGSWSGPGTPTRRQRTEWRCSA
jgi:hypothetical protein